ncbi:hypothetical protein AVEN_86875-1 [Araneus ventricosus]|uniref:Uncharacterized protein n=1 Tax=Araneus ventricosus TaxID=182803 RepID=A0A4Y2MFW4_ARAVE|nr:hypothetical protein AVEN_86875-1 [Araneus ventricosus]
MTVKLNYKKEKKSASYSHLSQEPHPFCTKGCNSLHLSGGFRNQQKILKSIAARLFTEELPCSNSPRVCAKLQHSGETSVNDRKVKGSRLDRDLSTVPTCSCNCICVSWVGIRPPAVRLVELRRQ